MAPRQQSQLDLSLSKESAASVAAFLRQLGEAKKVYTDLLNLSKKLGDSQKALEAKAAAGNLPAFNAGRQAQANRKAAGTILAGSAQGITLGDEREAARQAALRVRETKEMLKNQEAMNISLRKAAAETQNITNLTKLQQQLKLAEHRLGLEINAQDARRVGQARHLIQVTEQRIAFLKQEQAVVKETQRIEALRKSQRTPAEKAAQSRRDTNERLFGDGGANLLRIQAGLAANYVLLGGVRTMVTESLTFTGDLDTALRNLQAIVVVSDTGLAKLKDTIVSVAAETKFSAVEVAEAAVIMGQAGLSVAEIDQAIRATAMLATASGTGLSEAVALTTSVLGVFNLEAGQTTHVAHTLTEAVNSSKLDIEKLALALQYAGNTAAEEGVGFEELTAALGAMSNMGIRSGSTLGTGMRQVLISLQKPSKEFRASLDRIGLTMGDVDVRTHGLYGVMKNLSDAGFTASDAMSSFEVRGAAAYAALSKNLDQMLEMETSFYDSTAASRANQTQMRSLENQYSRFNNTLHAVVSSGLQPLLFVARDLFKGLGDLLGMVDQNGAGLKVFVTTVGGLLGLGIVAWAGGAILGLGKMFLASNLLTGGMLTLRAAVLAVGVTSPALAFLVPFAPIIAGLALAVGVGALAWRSYSNELAQAETEVAKAHSQLEKSTGEAEGYAAQLDMVSGKIQTLRDRTADLEEEEDLLKATIRAVKSEFIAMGLDVNQVGETVDSLIGALTLLQGKLLENYILKLEVQGGDLLGYHRALQGQKDAAIAAGGDAFGDKNIQSVNPTLTQYDPEGLVSGAKAALAADPTSDDLRRVQRDIRSVQAKVAGAPQQSNSTEATVEYLEGILEQVEGALDASLQIDQVQNQLAVSAEKLATAQSRTNPDYQGLQGRITAMRERVGTRVKDIQTNFKGDAVGGAAAVKLLQKVAEAEFVEVERELDKLVAAGGVTDGAAEELKLAIDQERLGLDGQVAGSSENAQPVREVLVGAKIDALVKARAKVRAELSEMTSAEGFFGKVAEVYALEAAYTDAMAEQSGVDLGTKSSDGETEAAQHKLRLEERLRKAETDAEVVAARWALVKGAGQKFGSGVYDSAVKFGEDYTQGAEMLQVLRQEAEERRLIVQYGEKSAQVENHRLGIAREIYKESIKQLPHKDVLLAGYDASHPKRNPLEERSKAAHQVYAQTLLQAAADQTASKQMQDALIAEGRLQQLISIFGEDSLVVAKARVEEERKVQAAKVETMNISVTEKATVMALWDATYGVTDATWGWADAMGEVASQIDGIMSALSALGGTYFENITRGVGTAILKKGGSVRDARRGEAEFAIKKETQIELAEAATGSEAERWLIKRREAARLFALEQIDERETLETAANERDREQRGNGGSGGGRADDASKDFVSMLEGNLGAALLDTTDARVPRINQVIETAQEELKRKATQIEFLRGQTLSTAKQKELNLLVEEHSKLQEFLVDTEGQVSRIAGVKISQQWTLNELVQDYVSTNLNLVDIAKTGVGSVLGGWKSAFSSLFSDISDGSKKGKDALRDFALASVKALQQVVVEMLAVYAMKKLLGWAVGAFGGADTAGGGFAQGLLDGLTGASDGGSVAKMAAGGLVRGNLPRDSVPALLMPDEFVLRASAVKSIGVENLERMNSEGNRRVSSAPGVSGVGRAASQRALNVWVAPPDQRPIPGPHDIIAIVSQDMAMGGSTKRLIKQIQTGG